MTGDLHAFVEHASRAAEVFFRPDGQMLAYFLAEDRKGGHTIIACPMGKEEELLFRIGVPLMLGRDGFVRWCFFTEAWLASYGAGQSEAVTPSARPDRMEVVTFFAEAAGSTETLSAHRQIYREGAAPAKLLPLVFAQERAKFVMGV